MKSFSSTFRKGAALALSMGVALGISGCGGDDGGGGTATGGDCEPASEIRIAYQPGLGYAPLLVAKGQGVMEEDLPDADITWQEMNSGAAIRDGIMAGNIHVGAGGIGPFLVGLDAGVDWKVLTGLNNMSLYLNTMEPDVQNLEDLKGAGSIAMPAPDSIQSVVLRKGAQEQLDDPQALDSQIVSMGHPDGVQALIGGQLAAHLTSPPFQSQEVEEGAQTILKSYDVFGEHTFNSVFTQSEFAECNPELVDALVSAVADANEMLTNNPEEASQILSTEMELPAKEVQEQITAEDISFVNTPSGFTTYAEFMQEIGMIGEVPDTEAMFFDTAANEDAS